MNLSASQCGSGCESGWTFYLDQSFCSQTWSGCESGVNGARFVGEDEDEGLSMVSDASSGPRQYYCLEKPVKKNSRNKKKIKEHCGNNQQHSCLDDTASSTLISFPEASSTILYIYYTHQYAHWVDLKLWCIYRRTSRKKLQ
ncbi:hypothetical protein V6N13_048043 [Hibiscus sabdariffa]|uniref:Uncharacterized protein n=1 Tax=Hibiscus sabdariffa TaxID=183260 RepID=A0ABR2F620_9ROSI